MVGDNIFSDRIGRPRKKLHPMAQTHRQTDILTNGHGDSEGPRGADLVREKKINKNNFFFLNIGVLKIDFVFLACLQYHIVSTDHLSLVLYQSYF